MFKKKTFSLYYRRGKSDDGSNYILDVIDVNNNPGYDQQEPDVGSDQIHKLNVLINAHFEQDAAALGQLFKNPRIFSQLIASHQQQVGELQKTVLAISEQAVDARHSLEVEYAERRSTLEKEIANKHATLNAEIDERLVDFSRQKQELENRAKQLDDRNNTHVRRQIRRDLKQRLEQHSNKFTVSDTTRRMRWPVHVGVWSGLIGLGALIFYFSSAALAPSLQETSWIFVITLLIKPLGLTLAMLGLGTWYLRWMNRWFEQHSSAEFQLKQLELDIDRASWVVETALEWRQVQDSPMPTHLLESISRNLFTKSDKDEGADMHPADYLASALLGKAAALRVALPGGGEVEWGPKALKQAGKSD
ncbi:hypothetical protein [Hansschlegelia zhihuaiae]|uniref:Uncharacterized protein n=1 Tax=Hansschlegelia zhihuaiae TaxID=405005 RepID=A0A4V1KID0_9HYPH|nr:hypothetical protein [Hansschlegelia zhihuaiae]RXF70262.1 hypothetical protein EK403_17035 [Hansschlegelia zhihuaiae]